MTAIQFSLLLSTVQKIGDTPVTELRRRAEKRMKLKSKGTLMAHVIAVDFKDLVDVEQRKYHVD